MLIIPPYSFLALIQNEIGSIFDFLGLGVCVVVVRFAVFYELLYCESRFGQGVDVGGDLYVTEDYITFIGGSERP